MVKNCQACSTKYNGRYDAKTCSVRCRKRLQRAKRAILHETEVLKQEAEQALDTLKGGISPVNLMPAPVLAEEGLADQSFEDSSLQSHYPDLASTSDFASSPITQSTVGVSSALPVTQLPPQSVVQPGSTILSLENSAPPASLPPAALSGDLAPPTLSSSASLPTTLSAGAPLRSQTSGSFYLPTAEGPEPRRRLRALLHNTPATAALVTLLAVVLIGGIFAGSILTRQSPNTTFVTNNQTAGPLDANASGVLSLNLDTDLAKGKTLTLNHIVAGPDSPTLLITGDLQSSGTLLASNGQSSLNNQGLRINSVLVCTAAGCTSTGGTPAPDLTLFANLIANQTFSGINNFTSAGNIFVGDGSGLTSLNASNISTGTLNDNRLSANIALLNNNQTFSGTNTFNLQLQAAGGINALAAYSFNGTAGSTFTCPAGDLLSEPVIQGGIITGGTCALGSGAAIATFQDSYQVSIPAVIVLNGVSGPISVQDAVAPLGTNLFQVTNNSAATKYFAVTATGIAITGNVNTTGQYQVGGLQISSANLSNDANLAKLNGTGPQTFTGNNKFTGTFLAQNASNSTTAFQIQNAAGTSNLLIADTTNSRVGIGKAPTLGTLDVNGTIFQSGNQVCDTGGNCAGVAGIGGSGTAGTIPVFTGTGTTIGNSLLTQSGGTITAAANLNITTGNQYQVNGVQISSANLSNDANLAKLSAGQTFSGANIFSNASNSFTGNGSGLTSLNASNLSSGTVADARLSANVAKLNGTGPQTFTGNNKFTGTFLAQNASNSTTAFQIQNAAGTSNLLIADTTNSRVGIGKAPTLGTLDVNGTIFQSGNQVCDTGGNCAGVGGTGNILNNGNSFGTAVTLGTNDNFGLNLEVNNTTVASFTNTGAALFKNSSNSTTAFQVQNVAGNELLLVDTSGSKVALGKASTLTGNLTFYNSGGAGNISLQAANPGASTFAITLPAVTGTVCLTTGNCAGVGGTGDILNNGNSFGSAVTIGTNDNFGLNLEVNNTTVASFTNTGLLSLQPTASLIAGQTALTQTLTNASSTGGTVNGYSQSITVSNASSASTTNGINISLADNASALANNDVGLKVALSGSNASQKQIGIDVSSTAGFGLRANATGTTSSSQSCGQIASSAPIGVCAVASTTGSGAIGVYGETNGNGTNWFGSGVYGTNIASGAALQTFTGVRGVSDQTANVASTSLGVYGEGGGGTGATAYGGYFTLNSSSAATAGSALYASNSTIAANILDLQDNTTNVLVVGDGGSVAFTPSDATKTIVLGSTSQTGTITLGQSTATNIISIGSAAGAGATQTINIGTSATATSTTTVVIGSTVAGATTLQSAGGVAVSTLGTANTATYLCRNGSNLISSCQTNVTGAAFLQGGNSFGATAVLGTNDSNSLTFETNNITQAAIADGGATTFKNSTDSTTAFQVQNAAGNNYLLVNTSGASVSVGNTSIASTIQVGNTTGAVAQTINIGNNATASSTTTVVIGSTVAGATTLQSAGGVIISTLGAADSTTILCRNTSNQVATCNSAAGTAFLQNGNSFGATAVLGTNDSNSLTFETNNVTQATIAVGGATTFANSANSTAAFQIQNAGGAQLLNVDTTNPITDLTNNGNNNLVTNGSFEAGTTGWSAEGAGVTLAQSNVRKYIGNDSLSITTPASTNRGAKYNLTTTTLASNTKYNLTLAARMAAGSTMSTFEIGRSEDGAADTSCLTAQTVNSAGWTSFSCSFTTGTTSGTPYIYVKQTDAVARTFFIDAVQLTRFSILANASIEQAISASNWQADGTPTTHARDTTQFYDGAASLKVVTQATTGQGTKQNITLSDNTAYQLTFYAMYTGTAFTTMQVGYASDGSTETNCFTVNQTVNTSWSIFSCNFTTPASHSGTPYVYIKNNTNAVRTFFLDSIQLTVGNPLTAYREGNIALNGIINSPVVFQSQSNSTLAFQIQNASGGSLLSVDTIGSNITLNGLNSGDLGAWKSTTAIPAARTGPGVVTVNGYIYVIGGDKATPANTVYYAKLGADGSISSWTNQTGNVLPAGRVLAGTTTANGYIYIVGGRSSSSINSQTNTVYYAKVNSNGSTGPWSTSSNNIPLLLDTMSVATANGYMYVWGGFDDLNVHRSDVWFAKINGDGSTGAFLRSTPMPAGRSVGTGVIANNYIYWLGGSAITGTQNNIYYAPLSNDGSVGTWTDQASNKLPVNLADQSVAVANGYIYQIAGTTTNLDSGSQGTVYYAPLSSTGATGAWNIASSSALPRSDTGGLSGGIIANGYIYQIGGVDTASVQQATVSYASTARIKAGGSLDLVGLGSQSLGSTGGGGGSLTAGNTNIVGDLMVQGQATINQGASINNNLTVNGSTTLAGIAGNTNFLQVQNSGGINALNINTVNLVGGSSFENSPVGVAADGWTAKGGSTLTTDSTQAKFGLNSLKVVTTGANLDGAQYYISSFAPSTTYTMSLYAKVASGSITDFDLGSKEDNTYNQCLAGQTVTTAWTRYTCNFTTASNPQQSGQTSYIYVDKSSASAETFFIDGLQLEIAGSASTYREADIKLDGQITFKNSADSAAAFQVQNAAGTSLLTVDTSGSIITIAGTSTTFASLTINNAHIKATQTTIPTIGTPANCGGGTGPTATVTAASTDSAGSFIITAGTTGSPTTCDTILTFNKTYGAAPKTVVITPTTAVGSATGFKGGYVSAISATTFTIKINSTIFGNPANSEINGFYYWVIE